MKSQRAFHNPRGAVEAPFGKLQSCISGDEQQRMRQYPGGIGLYVSDKPTKEQRMHSRYQLGGKKKRIDEYKGFAPAGRILPRGLQEGDVRVFHELDIGWNRLYCLSETEPVLKRFLMNK